MRERAKISASEASGNFAKRSIKFGHDFLTASDFSFCVGFFFSRKEKATNIRTILDHYFQSNNK